MTYIMRNDVPGLAPYIVFKAIPSYVARQFLRIYGLTRVYADPGSTPNWPLAWYVPEERLGRIIPECRLDFMRNLGTRMAQCGVTDFEINAMPLVDMFVE